MRFKITKEIFILLYIAGVTLGECPGGWTRRGDTAWCYKAFEDKTVSWNTAQQECTKYGADLVSYESKAEMEWVYNILNWNQDRATGSNVSKSYNDVIVEIVLSVALKRIVDLGDITGWV